MIISRENGLYCAKVFHEYFSNIGSTEEYMRDEKLKNVADMPSSLFPIEDDLFSDFSMKYQTMFGNLYLPLPVHTSIKHQLVRIFNWQSKKETQERF